MKLLAKVGRCASLCAVAAVTCVGTGASAVQPDNATDKSHPTQVIQTVDGPVKGFVNDGMNQFLGIPFAAPPVGDLRWRAPQPPKPWHPPFDAVKFGNICVARNTLGVFSST